MGDPAHGPGQDRFTALQSELRDKLTEEQGKRQEQMAKQVRAAVDFAISRGMIIFIYTLVTIKDCGFLHINLLLPPSPPNDSGCD